MSNKPSIVLATFTLQGGGAERFVLTLGQAFAKMGFSVHVVSFKSQVDYPLDNSLHYHYLAYQRYRSLPRGWLRYRLFAKVFDRFVQQHIGEPVLVISNLDQVDNVLHYSQLKNIVYVIHNTLSVEYGWDQQPNNQQRQILKQCYQNHPVVCVSYGVQRDFEQYLGKHPKITTIHNPIPQSDILTDAAAFDALAQLPDNCQHGYLIHVGKFKPQKDHHSLIKAYAKSTQQLPLVLLGTGEQMLSCQTLAADLGVAERVIFMGFQPNPYPFIKAASAMVLSSKFEGFGIVIAESLSLGVPVISVDCPSGPSELLSTHCLVPSGDIMELSDKMSQVMQHPKDFVTPFSGHLLPEAVAKAYLDFMIPSNEG
jgi:glycosyltransferase involved in cell wall biosynthesis